MVIDAQLACTPIPRTPTSISSRVAKNNQALIWQFPRAVFRSDGNPQATGSKNNDVMQAFGFQSSINTGLTNKHVWLDRIEYFE